MNKDVKERRKAPLETPTDLGTNARRDIAGALNALLADTFALYLKTKNFHWHVSGPHFRDYHLMFDEQADQILQERNRIAQDEPDSPYLFPFLVEPDPKRAKRYHLASSHLKRWGEKAGIPKVHFHLARHTFATLTITYGGDLFTVSKLLGHVSFQSTQIYAHVLNAPKLAAMDKLSQASRDMKQNRIDEANELKKKTKKTTKRKAA